MQSQKRIDFIDLKAQQAMLPTLIKKIQAVLSHGQYILGPEVRELEDKLAAYVGVKHAISCSSGTDALLMPLMAYGVGPRDAIFTTPFTFIATADVIQLLRATPVFVDIDSRTFNIDPEALGEAIAGLAKNPRTSSLKPKAPGMSSAPGALGRQGYGALFLGQAQGYRHRDGRFLGLRKLYPL